MRSCSRRLVGSRLDVVGRSDNRATLRTPANIITSSPYSACVRPLGTTRQRVGAAALRHLPQGPDQAGGHCMKPT